MRTRRIKVLTETIGAGGPPMIIAGPCVLEDIESALLVAGRLKEACASLGLPYVFKSSYDKANRSSVSSFRGPGLEKGLRMLEEIKSAFVVPVLSDVHSPEEAAAASGVLDILQVPAFLSRQTDLILAASRTGKPVNIKKGQFLSPWEMKNIIEKFTSTGNQDLLITERGTCFGYNNLVVDFRSLPLMRGFGYPVVFDMTHSVQLPGSLGSASGGQREYAAPLARAAVAAGVDGVFMEVHPEPEKALSDGPNMIPLGEVQALLKIIRKVYDAVWGS